MGIDGREFIVVSINGERFRFGNADEINPILQDRAQKSLNFLLPFGRQSHPALVAWRNRILLEEGD